MSSLEHTADDNPAIDRNFDKLRELPITFTGLGSPNGAVTASPGAIYVNFSGGAGTTLYVKESGVGTSAGWVGK